MLKVLIIDDDASLRGGLRSILEQRNYCVEECEDGEQAVAKVQADLSYDLAVIDVNMPKMSGLETLAKLKETQPSLICIILTAYSDFKDAIVAIKSGAFDYLQKPVEADNILSLIDSALEANKLVRAVAQSAPELSFDKDRRMIGNSNSIRQVFDIVYKLSKVDTPVLIRGESGTGKELVARAIHYNSHRRKGPFVAINCAAIPENLIESELFGHEKGAFTGADKRKLGKFQFAEGGTLFLDEIGDISLTMQVKLLRVLQENCLTPVGANREIKIETRVVAATNRPLEKMMEAREFRDDLFYRLNVLPINLPPLRDRREDISKLIDFMVAKFNKRHSRKIEGIDNDALSKLIVYRWPGNIRELENVIEHAFIIESDNIISSKSLPANIVESSSSDDNRVFSNKIAASSFFDSSSLNYPELKDRFEKEFILRALKAFDGKINRTAEHTKMTKVTLLRKLEKYKINPRDFHVPKS